MLSTPSACCRLSSCSLLLVLLASLQSSSTESLKVASSPSQSSCQLVLLAGEKEGGRQSRTEQEGFGCLLEDPGLNQSWNIDVAGAWLKQRVNKHVKPLFFPFITMHF